jgi:hypothetical protein
LKECGSIGFTCFYRLISLDNRSISNTFGGFNNFVDIDVLADLIKGTLLYF